MQINIRPRIFIGSSTEGLDLANAIQQNLDRFAEVTIWSQGVFQISTTYITALANSLTNFDYAIFVFSPDDITKMRGSSVSTVRDNVIYETGLFSGKIGIDRVFFVKPRDNTDLHLPTDLLGVVAGEYDNNRSDGNLVAATGPFCNQVRQKINSIGLLRLSNDNEFTKPNYKTQNILTDATIGQKDNDAKESIYQFLRETSNIFDYVKSYSVLIEELLPSNKAPIHTANELKNIIFHLYKAVTQPDSTTINILEAKEHLCRAFYDIHSLSVSIYIERIKAGLIPYNDATILNVFPEYEAVIKPQIRVIQQQLRDDRMVRNNEIEQLNKKVNSFIEQVKKLSAFEEIVESIKPALKRYKG